MQEQPLTHRAYRQFGFILALFIIILFEIVLPIFAGEGGTGLLRRPWPWVLSALLVGWAMVWPEGLRFVHAPWMLFGRYMAVFNTTLILTIVFYLFITPLAIVFRIVGRDAMGRKLNPMDSSPSHWKSSRRKKNDHMEKIY